MVDGLRGLRRLRRPAGELIVPLDPTHDRPSGPERSPLPAPSHWCLWLSSPTHALYSLHPGSNTAIASILRSVVVEEMLHLTLVANVINALGGAPVLDTAHLIPAYPGPLPGAVEHGLVVRLAPFSIDLVKDVFLKIEQPEHVLDFPVVDALDADLAAPVTIGRFSRRIRTSVAALGTVAEPLEAVAGGYAHFYRLGEIVHGGLLVPNPEADPHTPAKHRYLYDVVNHPVRFDPSGVFPLPTNPRVRDTAKPTYLAGSVSRLANDTFNFTYTSLLQVLHRALNGTTDLLGQAVGPMMSLRQQAMDMVAGSLSIGPTFEYQRVDPSGTGPSPAPPATPRGLGRPLPSAPFTPSH